MRKTYSCDTAVEYWLCASQNRARQSANLLPKISIGLELDWTGSGLWWILQSGLESLFHTLTPLLFQNFWIRIRKFFKFENPTPDQTPAAIDTTEINPESCRSRLRQSGSMVTSGILLNLDWIRSVKCFTNLGSGPDSD